jgi:tight adherence protein C
MGTLLPVLIAAAAAGSIVLIAFAVASGRSTDPVQARLSQLGTMQAKSLEELELQQPFVDRTLRPLASRISGMSRRFTSVTFMERTEQRLAQAGHPGEIRSQEWMGVKVLAAAVGALTAFVLFGLLFGMGILGGAALGAGGLILGYMAPDFWLGRRIKARQKAIVLQLPDVLDLLTISVRAGLGFDAALGKVVEKMSGPLPDEFRRALAEVRMGKTRRDALRDIVARTDVPPLTNFISAIIQAEQLGVSISKVLQVQSEQLRIERRQRAEEMAQRAPVKLLFPLVGCIFPCLLIILLGPALITVITGLAGGGFGG